MSQEFAEGGLNFSEFYVQILLTNYENYLNNQIKAYKGKRYKSKNRGEQMAFGIQEITLAIIIGTLAAIVYSLRILVLMERRIARIEMHIERVVDKLVKEEIKIERSMKRRR